LGLQGTLSTNNIGKKDITQLTNSLNNLATNPYNTIGSTSNPQGTDTTGTQITQGSITGSLQSPSGINTNTNLNQKGIASTLTQITSKIIYNIS